MEFQCELENNFHLSSSSCRCHRMFRTAAVAAHNRVPTLAAHSPDASDEFFPAPESATHGALNAIKIDLVNFYTTLLRPPISSEDL